VTRAVTTAEVPIDETWSVGGKPHGGYLLRSAVELALDEAHPHPLAVSAHYVSSPDHGVAQVEVERLRTGRRVASSRARISQHDEVRAEVLVSAGTLSTDDPYWTSGVVPPALPPVEDCPRTPPVGPSGVRVGYFDHVDLRMDPASAQWAVGRPQGQAEVRGWMRRADGVDASPLDLLVFADAMPPVTFDLGLFGWVPTLELTVHVRGLAAPGWLRVVQRATVLRDGWLDEDCLIWDSAGHLVAQARQLAGYRLPEA
jgi:acyl-CoA thioesterase